MKGGSAASTAVADLVKVDTYEQLNTQFDNLVGGKGQRKSATKATKKTSTTTQKEAKPAKTKSAKPKPVKAKPTDKKHAHKGGMCMICGGSLMKHMNDFDDKDLQSVFNKKGGAPNPLFNIKYDITSAFSQPVYGEVTSRALDAATMKQMSYENPSSLSPYNKFVQYGNVSGSPVMKFDYVGGKSTNVDNNVNVKKKGKKMSKA
jgi:hypothetical protein